MFCRAVRSLRWGATTLFLVGLVVTIKASDRIFDARSMYVAGVASILVSVVLYAMHTCLERGKNHVDTEMKAQRDYFATRCDESVAEVKDFLIRELARQLAEVAAKRAEREGTLEDTYEQGYRAGSRDSGTVPFPGTRNDARN
jgi:hypothetical protein